jgi:hypothetical protein
MIFIELAPNSKSVTSVFELIQPLLASPVLPATILLLMVVSWSLFTIAIGFGIDLQGHFPFHFHNPFHGLFHGLDDAVGAVVLAPTKWLNLRSVPFMLWLGVFAIAWWSVSLIWWLSLDDWFTPNPSSLVTLGLISRNLVCTLPLVKLATQPMQGWFNTTNQLHSKSLIGQEAEISSYDATPVNGQAKYKTGAAPLLLNVRTDGPHLPKGTRVWITHYDAKKHIYLVSPTTTDSSSTSTHS